MGVERIKADSAMGFEKFADEVYLLLAMIWGENWGNFVMTFPTTSNETSITLPTITYSLEDRVPGVVGKTTQELKPRERERFEIVNQETGKTEVIRVMARRYDCIVKFTVFAQNNQEVLKYTSRFQEVLDKYKGYLMKKGMVNMWFQGDKMYNTGHDKDDIAAREITYLVKLEEIYNENLEVVQNVIIEIDTLRDKLAKEGVLPSQLLS